MTDTEEKRKLVKAKAEELYGYAHGLGFETIIILEHPEVTMSTCIYRKDFPKVGVINTLKDWVNHLREVLDD